MTEWKLIDSKTPRDRPILCTAKGWDVPRILRWRRNERIVGMQVSGLYPASRELAVEYFGDLVELDDYDLASPEGAPTHWIDIPSLAF